MLAPTPPTTTDGDRARLERLALSYVARYATTAARLRAYLRRKAGDQRDLPETINWIEALVARTCAAGFVDDAAFAQARAASLTRRGYGARRAQAALRHAGIAGDIVDAVMAQTADDGPEIARHYAERRRIGPYSGQPKTPEGYRRALARLMRAGHAFDDARALLAAWHD